MAQVLISGKKKFVAFVSMILIWVLDGFMKSQGWEVPKEVTQSIIGAVTAYIGVEGFVDLTRAIQSGKVNRTPTSY